METTFDRQTVLHKTHYGIEIYSHIIRRLYPGEIVMHIKGRDCGVIRNPFKDGEKTLKVWTEKLDPDAELSDEIAMHKDLSGTIPDGNAMDFAKLYYGQSGQELLATLNREMHLNLDPRESGIQIHARKVSVGPKFSFFKSPITNTVPYKSITIRDTYNYIIGNYARSRTQELRMIQDKKRARLFKSSRFDYVTFSGEFDVRSNTTAKSESGLLCLDFDHVAPLEDLFTSLLKDEYFETALLFRSPSGDGIKWVIELERGELSHSDYYRAVENYILDQYKIQVDNSGKEISRACFLPYDPNAYINPNYR